MNKKLGIILFSAMAAFTAGAAVTASLSWFIADTTLPNINILGFSDGAYFAYGTGTVDDPYGIKTPKQLSNLAWLQYAGFFEKTNYLDKDDTDGVLDTVYFELANDIDCTGWTIPPIGTEEHPFIGEFNGNGYVINNLTVSNANSFTSMPRGITYETNPEIVGLFGVVGEYTVGENSYPAGTYESSTNQVVNTGINNLTVYSTTNNTLAGVVAGYVNGELRNVAVNNSKLYISQAGVQKLANMSSISDYSLVGYCTEDFKGKVSTYSTSMYGLEVAQKEFVAAEQNEEDPEIGWGGSINMADMYTRLYNVWNQFDSAYTAGNIDPITYYTEYHSASYLDGTSSSYYDGETANSMYADENGTFSSGSAYHSYFNYEYNDPEEDEDKNQTSSLSYVIQTTGTSTAQEKRFMCLTGYKTVTTTTRITNYTDTEVNYNNAICDGNGHFLASTSNGNISVVTTYDASTCSWTIDGNGYLKNSNRNTWLYCYNGANTIRAATSSQNQTYYKWTYDSTNNCLYTTYNNTVYGLTYSNNNFRTVNIQVAAVNGYTLSGNGYYLVANPESGTVTTTNNQANATKCLMNGNYYYVTYNNTTYYLATDANSGAILTTSTTNVRYTVNGNRLRAGGTGSRRYLVISNSGALSQTSSQNSGTTITRTTSEITPAHVDYTLAHVYRSGTAMSSSSSQSSNYAKFDIPHTYYPLVDGDTVGVPSEKNTGYVVSGGNYFGDPYGDIRVSEYYFDDLEGDGGSSGNRTLNTVYTIKMDGTYSQIEYENNTFTRYDKAHDDFIRNALNKHGNNIYGLHFMRAPITYGGAKSAVAEKAVINGDTFYNYEFPTDCIDFNLKEKGFITFFAGAYYTNNNCFFSLHKIYRNGPAIQNVMEIMSILSDGNDGHSYVYLLKDTSTGSTKYYYTKPYYKDSAGNRYDFSDNAYEDTIGNLITTNSSGTTNKPANYNEVFKTSQIKVNSAVANTYSNYAFYFEIPMNDGEFCLGSIDESGANGAYLMYLDIGANALKMHRTTFTEKFVKTERFHPYVLGVAWVNDVSSSLSEVVAQKGNRESQMALDVIDGSDSATVKLFEPGSGNTIGIVQINRTAGAGDAKDNIAMQITMTEKAKSVYIGSDVQLTINDSAVPMGEDDASSEKVETLVLRLEYWDYNTTTRDTVKTIITDTFTTTTNALGQESDFTATRTVGQYVLAENASTWSEIEESKWIIYNSESGEAMTIANIKDIECEEEGDSIEIESANETVILTYSYSNFVTEVIETYGFDVAMVSGTTYYVSADSNNYLGPGTFTITLETPDGSATIVVVTAHTFTITINGVTVSQSPTA